MKTKNALNYSNLGLGACPICYQKNEVYFYRNGLKYDRIFDFGIYCDKCNISIEGNVEQEVIDKWNDLSLASSMINNTDESGDMILK